MKKIILSAIFLMALVSCQEELLIKGDYPIEPVTKSGEEPSDGKEPAISKWDALKIVEPITNKYPDRWVDISDSIIPAKTSIAYNTIGYPLEIDDLSYCTSPEFDSWLIVVGFNPNSLGKQTLLHLFVNTLTGEIIEYWLDGKAIVQWDTSRNTYSLTPSAPVDPRREEYPYLVTRSSPTRWAVIVSGASNKYDNYRCIYEDTKRLYNTLVETLGFSKNNIFCLMSDGNDPGDDLCFTANNCINSNTDFDNDGYSDVFLEAKQSRISNVFNLLSLFCQSGDEVLIVLIGHGIENYGYCLWDGEVLTPSELSTEVDKLDSDAKIDIIMGQCNSGLFIPPLTAANRTITTASSASESAGAHYFGDNAMCIFLRKWINSIPYYDTVGDSYVTPSELYVAARDTISSIVACQENPQYNSNPVHFGKEHSIRGEIIPVIIGSNYLSQSASCTYSIVNYPASGSTTWLPGNYASVITSSDTTALITGNVLTPGAYYIPNSSIHARITVDGKTHLIAKDLDSIWRPGAYVGYHYITRTYNSYHLIDYFSAGTYPGTSNYQWFSNSPSWNIISQDGAYVTVQNVPPGTTNVSVVFEDPFGGTIYISDQVN